MKDGFTEWFDSKHLVRIDYLEQKIDNFLYLGRSSDARQIIDWLHQKWIEYWTKGKGGLHITGPYCRIGVASGFCRSRAKEALEDSTQDVQLPKA